MPMVQITNTNENKVDINISFSDVRKEIENMSALPDGEIEEILNKINELEKIVKSSDRKSKKWENAKGIVKWIADKGVDVGIGIFCIGKWTGNFQFERIWILQLCTNVINVNALK